jgi:DNA-binding NarL/FixJ family response regulator
MSSLHDDVFAISPDVRYVAVARGQQVRAALIMLLAGADDIEIVGEAADGSEVEHAVAEHQPDVVLMDIRMPGMDGLAAAEIVRGRDRPPEVIVLTTFDADDHVLHALRAGASGFLLKDTSPADIVRAIRAVAAGEPILSPTITRRLIGHVTGNDGGERRHAREQLDRVTERERQVAVAIGRAQSNAEISRELYMSIATVKAHVSRLLEKLEFNNRVQIALLAHDAGEA